MLPTPPSQEETMGYAEEVENQHVLVNNATDSAPLRGMDICCTALPDEKRTKLAELVQQMGAKHSYDLTLYVTHLIVGNYDTPKYRYVAKGRPDVRPMSADWIEKLRELWIEDQDIDMEALELEYTLPALSGLSISMTGCEDLKERQEIAEAVVAHGGVYSGDLSKEITHLISFKTEGAKYVAARKWGLRIVSIEWLWDSLERGMILDETLYDPSLPPEKIGKGAWNREASRRTSLGKRNREVSLTNLEEGKRKLRRTASTKLSSQHEGIWGDIVGGASGAITQVSRSGQLESPASLPQDIGNPRQVIEVPGASIPSAISIPQQSGMFLSCCFYLHGFTPEKAQILHGHLVPQDAEISGSFDSLLASTCRQYLMIPSDLPLAQHPEIPQSHQLIEVVTEWWLERCLHHKRFLEPKDHVIGRPFRKFPVPGFQEMTICSAAFSGIDLRHVQKATALLGATYSEYMTPQTTVLVTNSVTGLRKDRMDYAQQWGLPVVTASWLWDCIESSERLPFKRYKLRVGNAPSSRPATSVERSSGSDVPGKSSKGKESRPLSRSNSNTGLKLAPQPPRHSGLDNSAFESNDKSLKSSRAAPQPRFSMISGIDNSAFESDVSDASPKPHRKPLQTVTVDKTAFISEVDTEVKSEDDTQLILPTEDECQAVKETKTPKRSSELEPLSEISNNPPSKSSSTLIADAPAIQPSEDIANAVSNLLAKTKTVSAQVQESTEGGGRRRGRILGRVTSNVSTASASLSRATSVDSTATHGNCVEYPSHGSGKSGVSGSIEKFMNADRDRFQEEADDSQPPATQLQYLDDESEVNKERVMARMKGEKIEGNGRRMEKALTLGDLSDKPKARKTRAREKAGIR